jgi:hypothetical protein
MKTSIVAMTLILIGTQIIVAKNIKITEDITSVVAKDKGNDFVIKRIEKPNTKLSNAFLNADKECPPNCIQPMNIDGVKTVGELEVLKFIEEMKNNSNMLLIDTRTRNWYRKGTIPSAINLPYTMLKKDGKYIDKILTLLGGKKNNNKWNFNNAQTLLIFGNGIWDGEASSVIKNLLEMGYPAEKIKYYRGGVQMWNLAGLTIK